jgi:hypothetical protein
MDTDGTQAGNEEITEVNAMSINARLQGYMSGL